MSPLKLRLLQDRAMREAARQLVTTDVALLKADVEQHGVVDRAKDTGADYLKLIGDGAMDLLEDHRGKVAGGFLVAAGALAVWLGRDHIGDMIAGFFDGEEADQQEPAPARDIPEAR